MIIPARNREGCSLKLMWVETHVSSANWRLTLCLSQLFRSYKGLQDKTLKQADSFHCEPVTVVVTKEFDLWLAC
jgi:hypothetical protein